MATISVEQAKKLLNWQDIPDEYLSDLLELMEEFAWALLSDETKNETNNKLKGGQNDQQQTKTC